MLYRIIDTIGFAVCHQIPARSLTFFDKPPCLCARCLGMYSSLFLVLAYYFGYKVLVRKQRRGRMFSRGTLFFALSLILVLALDAGLQYLGLYFSNFTRLLSGVVFGLGLSLFLIALTADMLPNKKSDPVSRFEIIALLLLLVLYAVLVYFGGDSLVFIAHIFAALGIVLMGVLLNFMLISLIIKNKPLFWMLACSAVLVCIEGMVLTYFHAYFESMIIAFFAN